MSWPKVITPAGRQALLDYKYVSSSKSKLDEIMNYYWEFVVSFMPLTVAPNVITFTATIQFLISFFIFEYYASNFLHCVPSWVLYLMAIAMFVYQTLDAIDGKQARRTKSSSPLGQLFDHGNDALIFTPMLVSNMACVNFGSHFYQVLWLLSGYVVFYMINWRARHEGKMHFGIFSVTEAQFLGVFVYCTTAYYGCDIWSTYIGPMPLNLIFVNFSWFCAAITSVHEFIAVQKYYKKTGKEDPGQWVELSHMTLLVVSICCWNLLDVFELYPIAFVWIVALIFSGMVHRLVVNDVTHMKTKRFPMLLASLPLIIIFSIIEYRGSKLFGLSIVSPFFVYGVLAYESICWLAYICSVINEITDMLNIRLFVIRPPSSNNNRSNRNSGNIIENTSKGTKRRRSSGKKSSK